MPKRIKDITEWNPKEGGLRSYRDDRGEWVHDIMTMQEFAELHRSPEQPDKQFYDVCWYRSNPFGLHDEPFKPHIEAVPSEHHQQEAIHKCHIGVDLCARVVADNEDDAIRAFLELYDWVDKEFLYG